MRFILSLLWLVTPLSSLADTGPVENRWGMTFLAIPSGQFIMGTRDIDAATMEHPSGDASQIRDETPPHPVNISAFHLGRTEVTQQQWLAVMDTRPGPEANWQREDWQKLPVVTVSWHRVMDFINALNKQDSAYDYRLPTEAEWEYAARGGRDGLRPFDIDKLDEYAWTISNSGDSLQAVATRREILLAFTTCMAMHGNGHRTGTHRTTTRTHRQIIRKVRQTASSVSGGEVLSTVRFTS